MGKFVGVAEAAQRLGLSPYHIRQGIHCGRFPAVNATRRGKMLVDVEEIEQILRREADEAAAHLRAQSERWDGSDIFN